MKDLELVVVKLGLEQWLSLDRQTKERIMEWLGQSGCGKGLSRYWLVGKWVVG